jgi:hypothetical protein
LSIEESSASCLRSRDRRQAVESWGTTSWRKVYCVEFRTHCWEANSCYYSWHYLAKRHLLSQLIHTRSCFPPPWVHAALASDHVIRYDVQNRYLTSRGSTKTKPRNLEPPVDFQTSYSRQTSQQDNFPYLAWLTVRRISQIECDRYDRRNMTTKNVADGKVLLLYCATTVDISRIADRYPYQAYFHQICEYRLWLLPFYPQRRPVRY